MTIKLFVGQVNSEKLAMREDEEGAAFLEQINKIPVFLTDTSMSPDDYLLLGAVDRGDEVYRRAVFQSLEDMGYTDWMEFQDLLDREAFEPDGAMYVPRNIVEVLAEEGTPEFEEFTRQTMKSEVVIMQRVLAELNGIMGSGDIPTLAHLKSLVEFLPSSYTSRIIQNHHAPSKKVHNGSDMWVTNGASAEIAGEKSFPYRDNLPDASFSIQDTLDILDDSFEEAELSPLLIRSGYMHKLAVLQSENYTVYINDRYTDMLYGADSILIGGALKPVFIKSGGKVVKIIMPFRIDPCEDVTAESREYQDLIGAMQNGQ